jgi:hypothetical protein
MPTTLSCRQITQLARGDLDNSVQLSPNKVRLAVGPKAPNPDVNINAVLQESSVVCTK